MVSHFAQEYRGFYIYFFLSGLTVLGCALSFSPIVFSTLITLWGLFGFYRYLYLNSLSLKIRPKILTLPSRILFGFRESQDIQSNLNLGRFFQKDFVLFFVFCFLFLLWGLYCTLYPLQIELFEFYWQDKRQVIPEGTFLYSTYYSIVKNCSFFFMIGVITLTGLTYPSSQFFSKYFRIVLSFVGLVYGLYIVCLLPLSHHIPYESFSYVKGLGWDRFEDFKNLSGINMLGENHSHFVKRYVETGLLGAVGAYIIFLPFVFSTIYFGFQKGRYVDAGLVFFTFLLVTCFDFFWIWHPFLSGYNIFILSYSCCCWAGFYREKEESLT